MFHLQGPAPCSGALVEKVGWGIGWPETAQTPPAPHGGEWITLAIWGLPLTFLPTACHLTSPQLPSSLEGGASEMGSGRERLGRDLDVSVQVLGAPNATGY